MRAVVILTIVALFGAVACWKPVFHPRWNMTKNHTHHNHTHHHNHTKNHTWNSKGYKFAEETAPAPSFVQKMKNHAKKLWAKRPWKKSAPAPVAPEASFFNFTMPSFNLSHFHLPSFNWTKPTHHWNPKGFKFVEEEVKPQTFTDKIKHHAKKLWAKRPWKKATPAPVPETSSWNPAGHHIHHWNHTNKTHNHTHHHNHTKNHTWNNQGWRFEETAPAQGFLHTIKHHAKKLWAKRPWKKSAPAPVAPESSSWNSAGYHFPTWNHTNQTNHTWNNQGYRFEETAAPSIFDKITNTVKGIWAKRPWKKAD